MSLTQAYRGGYEGRPGWWLHFSYDEELVERFKTIPASQRTWDEEKKRWWVAEEAVQAALRILPSLEAHLRQGSLL